MRELTPEGRRIVEDVAARHGVSAGTVRALLEALARGGGTQAQFDIPELGGMGQWSGGGMVMVGDMFNHALKARVDALCTELAGLGAGAFAPTAMQSQSQSQGGAASLFVAGPGGGAWWPEGLGAPASTGAQNDMRYAYFPQSRRLALAVGGQVTVYDTGDHRIAGFGQQQSGDRSLTFISQHGTVRVADLAVVAAAGAAPAPPAAAAAPAADDVLAKIERLAELRARDILTEQEFEAKKAELLARL
jgi:Short C-terminal domain